MRDNKMDGIESHTFTLSHTMWRFDDISDTSNNGNTGVCVSHATSCKVRIMPSFQGWTKGSRPGLRASAVMGGLLTLGSMNMAMAADPTCVNYYTVGESDCRPAASTPVKAVSAPPAQLLTPQQTESEVDKYLANYGKPPREFVEFYLNPTPENASRWVETYQGMIKKGQDISKAWGQAEQLYAPAQTVPARLTQPVSEPAPSPVPIVPVMPMPPISERPLVSSFGAFSNAPSGVQNGQSGVRQNQVAMTYYYSQTCPYCARMTPDLAVISKELSSKLTFTCVDVTPVGPTTRPNEAYIAARLPCKWRLPEEGEVARENVAQTPTLIIQKEGGAPVRLSGYVPLAQLRAYFQ